MQQNDKDQISNLCTACVGGCEKKKKCCKKYKSKGVHCKKCPKI